MRIPRVYHSSFINDATNLTLSDDATNHIARVLRMKFAQDIILFDGSGYEFYATIIEITKKLVIVKIKEKQFVNKESSLNLHLGQVISRGEKMEFTIQKSVELGVNTITPIISERCGVRLDKERFAKKLEQWQKIIISACEQCGRNIIPQINPVVQLKDWCKKDSDDFKLYLNPQANNSINTLKHDLTNVRLLIGSEGGFSKNESAMIVKHGFHDILLGKRILRTETASLTAITALQVRFGDIG